VNNVDLQRGFGPTSHPQCLLSDFLSQRQRFFANIRRHKHPAYLPIAVLYGGKFPYMLLAVADVKPDVLRNDILRTTDFAD
jgi:hypothetical protein